MGYSAQGPITMVSTYYIPGHAPISTTTILDYIAVDEDIEAAAAEEFNKKAYSMDQTFSVDHRFTITDFDSSSTEQPIEPAPTNFFHSNWTEYPCSPSLSCMSSQDLSLTSPAFSNSDDFTVRAIKLDACTTDLSWMDEYKNVEPAELEDNEAAHYNFTSTSDDSEHTYSPRTMPRSTDIKYEQSWVPGATTIDQQEFETVDLEPRRASEPTTYKQYDDSGRLISSNKWKQDMSSLMWDTLNVPLQSGVSRRHSATPPAPYNQHMPRKFGVDGSSFTRKEMEEWCM